MNLRFTAVFMALSSCPVFDAGQTANGLCMPPSIPPRVVTVTRRTGGRACTELAAGGRLKVDLRREPRTDGSRRCDRVHHGRA